MSTRRIAEVAAVARARGGMVTTAELVAAGLDPRIAGRHVRSGHWQRPEPPGLTIVPRGPLLR